MNRSPRARFLFSAIGADLARPGPGRRIEPSAVRRAIRLLLGAAPAAVREAFRWGRELGLYPDGHRPGVCFCYSFALPNDAITAVPMSGPLDSHGFRSALRCARWAISFDTHAVAREGHGKEER
jgi:hypothetical protein